MLQDNIAPLFRDRLCSDRLYLRLPSKLGFSTPDLKAINLVQSPCHIARCHVSHIVDLQTDRQVVATLSQNLV